MVMNLAVRISVPWQDLSGTVRSWALKADRLVCYEHDDDGAERIHCHLLMLNVSCSVQNLKTIANGHGVSGSGNTFWSFKQKSKKCGPVTEESAPKYITYMTKGKYNAKYVKCYDAEYLDDRKAQWVVPEEQKSVLEQKYDAFDEYFWAVLRDNPSYCQTGTYILMPSRADVLVSHARSWAFSVCKRIWNVQTAGLAKMVFLTYAMRNGVVFDENKVKVW